MVKDYNNYGKNMISMKSAVTLKILNYFFLNMEASNKVPADILCPNLF